MDGGDPLVPGLVLGAVALAMVAFFGRAVLHDLRLARRMTRVLGRIVESRAVELDGETRFECIVEFVPEGRRDPLRFARPATYDRPRWMIGDETPVRYDPRDPSLALAADDHTGHRELGRPFLAVGVLLLVIAAFLVTAHFLGPDHPITRWGSQLFGS